MSLAFKNKKKHFQGTLVQEGVLFEYDLYLGPFHKGSSKYKYIVEHISKRTRAGLPCLGITEDVIKESLRKRESSVYGFVRVVGTGDAASGALQAFNWCTSTQPSTWRNSQVWIGDLCRTVPGVKSPVSPTKVLLFLFEQLCPLNKISLSIETGERGNLEGLYRAYGFRPMARCPSPGYLNMVKPVHRDPGFQHLRV